MNCRASLVLGRRLTVDGSVNHVAQRGPALASLELYDFGCFIAESPLNGGLHLMISTGQMGDAFKAALR